MAFFAFDEPSQLEERQTHPRRGDSGRAQREVATAETAFNATRWGHGAGGAWFYSGGCGTRLRHLKGRDTARAWLKRPAPHRR